MHAPRSVTALLACVAGFGAAGTAQAAGPPPGFKPFAPDSTWNLPLRADAPVAARSDAQVAWLRQQMVKGKPYLNSTSCGMPSYWAEPDTARVKVKLDARSYQDKGLIRAWSSVPMPAEARPAACSDANVAILQRQPDGRIMLWEFWKLAKQADGSWSARWGGVTQDVMADRGIASPLQWRDPSLPSYAGGAATGGWNVTASSVSMIAGVITEQDMRNGSIEHALALAIPDAAKGRWSWPAQRTDGGLSDADALPEGARLRLDPSLDLSRIRMVPLVRMIAEAAQRHGIVVRDRTHSATVFYAEEPHAGTTSPVRSLLDGQYVDKALAAFPWDKLEVLEAPSCRTWNKCTVTPRAVIDVDTVSPKAGEAVSFDTTNSVLEHPRTSVAWDLDGNGSYEVEAGTAVKGSFTPATGGVHRIGVRIATRGGAVTTGSATITVAPRPVEVPAQVAMPSPARTGDEGSPVEAPDTIVRPSSVTAKWFYRWSSKHDLLTSIDAATEMPARPDPMRKLYGSSVNGSFDVRFAGAGDAAPDGASARAWVNCSAVRCVNLRLIGADGATLASAEPAFGSSGWVTVQTPEPLTGAEVGGLRLAGATRNAASTSGKTSVAAIRLTLRG